MTRVDWDRARCIEIGTDPFFADGRSKAELKLVRMVCDACPIQYECLDRSISREEEFGVWGGLTPNERLELLREIHGPDYVWPGIRERDSKCAKGIHDMDEENEYVRPDGTVTCLACRYASQAKWKETKKELAA